LLLAPIYGNTSSRVESATSGYVTAAAAAELAPAAAAAAAAAVEKCSRKHLTAAIEHY
jgi:hypothetical protein